MTTIILGVGKKGQWNTTYLPQGGCYAVPQKIADLECEVCCSYKSSVVLDWEKKVDFLLPVQYKISLGAKNFKISYLLGYSISTALIYPASRTTNLNHDSEGRRFHAKIQRLISDSCDWFLRCQNRYWNKRFKILRMQLVTGVKIKINFAEKAIKEIQKRTHANALMQFHKILYNIMHQLLWDKINFSAIHFNAVQRRARSLHKGST